MEKDIQNGDMIFEEFEIEYILDSAIKICIKSTIKRIKFELVCDPDIKAKISILLLQQAMINLIENAIQYSEEDSIISVFVSQDINNIIII